MLTENSKQNVDVFLIRLLREQDEQHNNIKRINNRKVCYKDITSHAETRRDAPRLSTATVAGTLELDTADHPFVGR